MPGVASFLRRFPEFEELQRGFILEVLNEAKLEVDKKVWALKYKAAVMYLAADKLACSPLGQPAMLQPKEQISTYRREFERIQKGLVFGFRVV